MNPSGSEQIFYLDIRMIAERHRLYQELTHFLTIARKACQAIAEGALLRPEFSPLKGATRGGYHRSTNINRQVNESEEEDLRLD